MSDRKRGHSPTMNARQARSLEFRGPPVPKFLQALHSQVHGSKSSKPGAGGKGRSADELEDLLGIKEAEEQDAALAGRKAGGDMGPDEDISGDEWDGAQIVVLKGDRHMTEDEVRNAKQDQETKSASVASSTPADARAAASNRDAKVSQPGMQATLGSKRRAPIDTSTSTSLSSSTAETAALTGISEARASIQSSKGGMEDAKELILAEKKRRAAAKEAEVEEQRRVEEGEKDRKRKMKEETKERKNKVARKEKKKSGKGLSFDLDE